MGFRVWGLGAVEGVLGAVGAELEFFMDNLLVRIHFIIVMIRWTGLAPWEFSLPWQAFWEPSVPNLARSESFASARACANQIKSLSN